MKTLSVTKGRQRLGYWLKRAINGEDIGVIVDGTIVALRPVAVYSADYALREYDMTEEEADRAVERISKNIASERKRGLVRPFTGELDELRH